MERRLFLVFALTFLVIILFQPLLKKFGPTPPETKPESTRTQNQAAANPPPAAPAVQPTPSNPPATTSSSVSRQGTSESETVVENGLYRLTFTNRGAQVKS